MVKATQIQYGVTEGETTESTQPVIRLRSQPMRELSEDDVKKMLKENNLYCAENGWLRGWSNPTGSGWVGIVRQRSLIRKPFDLSPKSHLVFFHTETLPAQYFQAPVSLTLSYRVYVN